MNERNGNGDEKPWVACVAKDVSAQWQFSEGGAPRKSAEENQQAAGSSYRAVAAERQRRQQRQRQRQLERKRRSEVWIGFVSFVGKRSNMDCLWAGDEWVAGRVRRLGGRDVTRGAVSLPSGRVGCHWFGFRPDLGALGWQDRCGVLTVELDAAGQITIIHKLKPGEMVTTSARIGRKVETVEYKNLSFAVRSAGGQDRIQPQRRQYYWRINTIDSNDRDRYEETNEELVKMLNEDEMCDASSSFF